MAQTLDYLCKGIEFTQSHRPKEAIADSYDKCEPGLSCIHYIYKLDKSRDYIDHAFNENLS